MGHGEKLPEIPRLEGTCGERRRILDLNHIRIVAKHYLAAWEFYEEP
jgi:hypothetical protein